MKKLLTSKRFWATVTAVIAAAAAAATGEVSWATALYTGVGSIASYVLGLSVEQAGGTK